jgi:hypothetical protein
MSWLANPIIGAAARIGQIPPACRIALHEFAKIAGVGAGKGGIDRLVGVTHPHPVLGAGGQQPQHPLLHQARVLRLILQHKWPAFLQPQQIALVALQRPQRQHDQVVEVHAATDGQAALVVAVDLHGKVEQRPTPARLVQRLPGIGRIPAQLLDEADGNLRQLNGVLFHSVLQERGAELGDKLRRHVSPKGVGLGAQKGAHGVPLDLVGRAVIDDGELLAEPHQPRPLAHDVVGQPVQRAHPVADAGQEPFFLAQDGADAGAEVGHRTVGEGDDQHLTVAPAARQRQPLDQLRGEQTQCKGFAAAGDGADAHVALAVGEDGLLGRSGVENAGHG